MLRIVFLTAQGVLLALILWELVVALWGWKAPRKAREGTRQRRFRVVIPARDEAGVIAGVLGDVAAQDYPADQVDVWVIADRCRDDTASVAAAFAKTDVRNGGPDGKGAALVWHLERLPLAPGEALVVLDADNRVPPEMLARFADELDDGGRALQAYLDVTNPDGSLLSTASALTYWASNRMVQAARHNLGWGADLGGTGMCLDGDALAASGGFHASLAEDQDLAARMHLAGFRVRWLHDVRIGDEKPEAFGAAVGQRARWASGKRSARRTYVGRLLANALRRRSAASFDLALRLVQPGRSFVALTAAALAVASGMSGSRWLLPWPLWAAAAGLLLVVPFLFLLRDGAPRRYLVRYPLIVLIPLLWLPVRIASRLGGSGWYRTPRRAAQDPGGPTARR